MIIARLFTLMSIAMVALPADAATYELTAEQRLGKQLYRDRDLSLNRNQACASCHRLRRTRDTDGERQATPGFVDARNTRDGSAVSPGSVPGHFGHLNSPSSAYAAFSPIFHWDPEEELYVGGQFWNGRAHDLAEQATLPFVNPDEMAMPSHWAVVTRLKEKSRYASEFSEVYDIDLDAIPAKEGALPGDPPPSGVEDAYDRMTRAIAAFERIRRLNRFTSKFDFYLAGQTELTETEAKGLEVFESETKGNCAACHPSTMTMGEGTAMIPPLFTDFTYDNIGLPRNVNIPGNPLPDPGLGGRGDIAAEDPDGLERGKHKVMGLRNIAVTAPYGHNGVFATLEQIVHFYNTRDTLGPVPDNNDPGFAVSGWPAPEIAENVNVDELGDLGLTAEEEAQLVAFLRTLTDNYPKWGGDPLVPPGTPSPFADSALPPFP
ncbi:MAG TPA: cytochrome c peroxidase [Candidatus Limnocylindrales bacterium]|nr:cytochrome c peroxidase [Candidatus Limnocylindrales bacterium]